MAEQAGSEIRRVAMMAVGLDDGGVWSGAIPLGIDAIPTRTKLTGQDQREEI